MRWYPTCAARSAGDPLAAAWRALSTALSATRTCASPLGSLLHRAALSIAAEEIHPSIRARGIALEDVLDQTHRLDVLAPVERGAEAQTRDGVRHRHLVGRLPPVLAA